MGPPGQISNSFGRRQTGIPATSSPLLEPPLSQSLIANRTTPSKRPRSISIPPSSSPTLPPHRRIVQKPAPKLKKTNMFIFQGLHPLFTRHVYDDDYSKMIVRCTYPGCSDKDYIIPRINVSPGNFTRHYERKHPGIPTSRTEEAAIAKETHQGKGFFVLKTPAVAHADKYKSLLLDFIVKNNLSFRVVN